MGDQGEFEPAQFVTGMVVPAVWFYDGGPASTIRNEHLSHEASVRSIGTLYGILSFVCLLAVGVGIIRALAGVEELDFQKSLTILPTGIVLAFVARGLRKLRSWTLFPAALVSLVFLPACPLGTFICIRILYLLFSYKGGVVLSAEYRDVIRQTPHIKYKTSIVVWILLAMLLVGLGVAFMVIAAGF